MCFRQRNIMMDFRCTGAVSYTHLDVYKRQVCGIDDLGSVQTDGCFIAGLLQMIFNGIAVQTDNQKCLIFTGGNTDPPEDVYKRQALYGYENLGFALGKVDGSEIQSVIDSDSMYVRALKFLFEANQKGLIDPESTTQNFDTLQTKFRKDVYKRQLEYRHP